MKLKKLLPIIGIAIFIYIILKLDITNIIQEIKNANINFLLIAIFFVFLSLITQTLKWFVIAKKQKTKIPFTKAFQINLIGNFYGFITPGRIGNAIRAEYLKKYNNNKLGKGLSNFTLDKVFDISSLVLIAIVFSFVFKDFVPQGYLTYFILVFIFLIAGLIIFIDQKRTKKILMIFYKKFVPKKIKAKLKTGFYSFYKDMPKKRYFILFLFFNLVNWIILYTSIFFIGISLGIEISFFYYLAILPVTTLIAQIPITISGFGTREASMIYLFGLLGISATKVFSMSIISLAIGLIPIIIGSFLIFKVSLQNQN